MNSENLKNIEETEKIIDNNEVFSPTVEISNENPDLVKKEIIDSLDKFVEQDKKIIEIEESVNLNAVQDIEEIKNEINLESEIKKINTEANELKDETILQIEALDETQTKSKDDNKTENYIKADEEIKRAEIELEDLSNRKAELMTGEYDIRKKSIEIRILSAKGNILNNKNEAVDELSIRKENHDENDEEIIKPSIQKEKLINEKINNFIEALNSIEERAHSFGYDLESVVKFEDSEDSNKNIIYKQVVEFAETLGLDENGKDITEKEPNKLFGMLCADKIQSSYFRKHIFNQLLEIKEIDQDKLVDLAFSKIINNENNKELISDLEIRLSKDKQDILKKLSVEDIINSWEQDYPTVKGWSEKSYGTELNTFEKKIGLRIKELSKNGNNDEILKLKERLDILSEGKDSYSRNTVTFEESYPEWLKKLNINKEDTLKILTKSLSEKEFKYYMSSEKNFVPFHLIPENLSHDEKNKYYDRVFKSNFKIDDLIEYEKLTNKNPKDIVVNIINSFSYQTDGLEELLLTTRLYMLNNNIPEDSLVETTQECFIKELSVGNIKESKKIIKGFNLAEEFINKKTEEIFLRELFNGNIQDSLRIKNNFKIDEVIFSSSETELAVKKCFKDQVINGNIAICEQIINEFNLPDEFFKQNDIIKALQESVSTIRFNLESFNNFEKKFKLKENIKLLDNGEIKEQSLKQIEDSIYFKNNSEQLPEKIKETLNRFENQYGNKGKDLVNLAVYTYGVENIDRFMLNMNDIENVLNKYNPDSIPEDGKVSMGIEYEVTSSISDSYKENSLLGYKNDISLVSEIGNIGKGSDAVHEIALKPNYNPYMLMAEMKLLQDSDFLDFNFEKYQKAPRGYHLSLVGDRGLEIDENMYFLNNIMTMTQISGITAGKEVASTKNIHQKSFDNITGHKQKGVRCEIKGMATDSIEQFEKAIITAHHAGIAIQLFNKYLDKTFIPSELSNSPEDFEKTLTNSGSLLKQFESNQERDIVYEWAKLKKETMDAVDQHNNSFVDSEFNGFVFGKDGEFNETLNGRDRNLNSQHLVDSKITQEELMNKIKITNSDLFINQTISFVNQLTRLNNFFLLKSIDPNKGQYTVIKQPDGTDKEILNLSNIHTLWNMRSEGNNLMENNYKNPQNISLFDNGGEIRDGYYCMQGASEEMIIHKSQILLNHFNKNIEKLLETKGVERKVEKEELVAA